MLVDFIHEHNTGKMSVPLSKSPHLVSRAPVFCSSLVSTLSLDQDTEVVDDDYDTSNGNNK